MLSDQQKSLIDKVSRASGFKDFSISVERGSKKGDNYLGNIYLITVTEKDASATKSFILKCAETDPNVRLQMPIHQAYQREIFVYQTVLPMFESFQNRYRVKYPFRAFTKLLGSSAEDGSEFLLLENIKSQGFHMLDRRKTMDDEHVGLVFRELAKLHSVSLAMNHLEPENYKSVAEHLWDYFTNYGNIRKSFEAGITKAFGNALKAAEGHQKATKALKKYQKELEIHFREVENETYHLTIIHGDAWCNNMMFKYDDQANPIKPSSMCFLDWQISRVQTPVSDLFYFLFYSASKPTLDIHQKYLDMYYKTVEENLLSFGCDAESIFPYKLFKEHWSKFVGIGLCSVVSNLQAFLSEEKDAKSLSDLAECGNDILSQVLEDFKFTEEYYQRIRDIIFMLVENDYI